MFTGLVEGTGKLSELSREESGIRFTISVGDGLADGCRFGDSVSISGCCLTVVQCTGNELTFEAGPETLSKTTLGEFQTGHVVNIERSLAANGRLGGHFVQGHVDGVASVEKILDMGEWSDYWFSATEHLTEQMVPKGSVTVDGVSLTLVDVEPQRFSVALIPHTLKSTTLGMRKVGGAVNIETDILGKYVRKFCSQ